MKAQGVKGEVKIRPYSGDPARFLHYGTLVIGGCPFTVRTVSARGGFAYVTLTGVETRNDAETLVGRKVEIDRSMAGELESDEYYVVDLVGCRVLLSDGRELGTLESVDNYGSADVFTVKGERTVRFPFLKRLGLVYDADARTITLDAERLEEVCCYED